MEKITKSFLALVLMFVGMVSALAQPVAPKAPEAPAAPKASAFVTDGSTEQYLYNVEAKGFFIGANDWGTRASFSAEKGYKVRMALNADGQTYTLNNEAKGGNSADCQGVDQIWVDGAGRAGDGLWTVTVADDGSFKLGNTNVAGFLSVVPSKNDTKLYMSEADEAQSVWIAVSAEDYAAYLETVPAYQEALKEYNEAYAQYQVEYAAWFKENYKAGDELAILAPATWEGQGGDYGGLANPSKEKYSGAGSLPAGEVLTQTIEGLKNGKYNVKVEFAGSFTSGRGFECPTGDGLAVAFANTQEENLPIVDRTWVGEGQQNFYNFQNVEVTDGTLKYGIKNVADAGNWYVARLASITMVPEPEAWYNENTFCYKDAANGVSRSMELPWVADPDDAANGCITLSSAADAANDHDLQFMIRGAEYDGADLMKGAFAEGIGFNVSFKVKADGNYSGCAVGTFYSTVASGKDGWKFGAYTGEKLDVTTEWKTVSFTVIAGSGDAGKLTAIGFNLADNVDKKARTFYFDDVKITRGGSEWYVNNEFHAKDYLDPAATYADGNDPHPVARYVADAEGGYVEVISNANAGQTYNSQLWIAIPEKYVGGSTKMTMEVQASKAIKCPESFQATATGNGWGCNPGPGSGVEFTVGEWTTVTRVLNTKNVKSTGTWRDRQADQYCLDLSENTGDKEAITYKFRNVKFEDAEEAWTTTMAYRVKVTPFTYNEETGAYDKGADTNAAPTYSFGTGGAEGGYYQVEAAAKQTNTYETQFFFQIADVAPSKALKVNETVNLKFKVKALATETLPAETALSLGGGYHKSNDGAGWLDGAPAAAIKVGEWTPVELKLEIGKADVTSYSIDLSQDDKGGITYLIDDVEATWAEAPVLDWVELISNGDCEAAPEHVFAASKETPVDGSNTNQSRYVDSGDVTYGKVIEVAAGAKEAETWDNQFWIYEPYALPAGTNIVVEFDYKAETAAKASTQSHNAPGAYLHWAAIGDVNFTTEWQHFKYEGKIANECDDNGTARFRSIAFNLSEFADANKYYIDNVSFKVPAGTVDGLEPVYIDDYKVVEYKDPSTLEFTDNLFTNGDIEGEDMGAFIAKVNDDADALLLPAGTKTFKGSNQILVKSVARPVNDDETIGGNDHDTQFFVRLPYALPQGTTFFFSVDYLSNKVATIPSQTHGEPGQWKGNKGVGSIATGSDAQTLSGYFKAEADMRSIAFNLAAATEGGQFYFDNFVFKVVKDDEAAIKEFTATWDGTSTWNETFALNQAVDAGRTTEIEGKGYTAESVQALTDAIAAGKAELANAEATKETLAAAAKAIEDAIAGLEKGGVIEDCDLTADMFFTWDAVDATASKTGQAGCAYDIEKSTGMPYGDGTVNEYNYADLTAYDHLAITATEGEPRLLFNRAAQDDHQGPLSVELPRDFGQNKFEAIVDNGDGSKTYVINLKAITEKDGYAHLHAIKGANWANTTVTAMKLFVGASEYSDVLTNINGVEDGASVKDGKYFINGQIVIVKNGVKYNAAGVAIE